MPKSNKKAGVGQSLRSKAIRWAVIAAVVVAVVLIGVSLWSARPKPVDPAKLKVVTEGQTKGTADSPVTVIEYADFQCPACGYFATAFAPTLTEDYIYSGKVQLVFKDFAFLGSESNWAAEAAKCAAEQGHFWEYHDRLFQNQRGENRGAFSRSNLKQFATQVPGLDTTSFNQCLDSRRYAQAVVAETEEGKRKGVGATPTFFVNGRKVEGADYERLRRLIEDELLNRP